MTIIESGPQLMGREDIDVSREMRRILSDEGIRVRRRPNCSRCEGNLETRLCLSFARPPVIRALMAVTFWSRLDAFRTPAKIGLEDAGVEPEMVAATFA